MTTVRLGEIPGLDALRFEADARAPLLGPNDVLVRVEASSLNYHDYNVAIGRLPSKAGRILLTDAAGVIEDVGSAVTEFAIGDSVISCFFPQWLDGEPKIANFSTTPGDGVDGYARRYAVRPSHWFTHAPHGLTMEEAATLPTAGLTAWRALVVSGKIKQGDSVLVLGTGGVSIFALQLARMMGADVIATSSSDSKLERAKALGALETINYKQVPEWGKTVLDLTGGRGVDHVVEVGGPGTLPQSISACRIGGHIALIGVLTGIAGAVPTAALMGRQQRLQGITVGSRSQQQDMVRAFGEAKLKPVIDRAFKLAELVEAFRYEEAGGHFGKIAIQLT